MFKTLDRRLRQIKGPGHENQPFGGMNILVLGDLKQLKPVSSQWIYTKEAYTVGDYDSLVMANRTNALWDLFDMLELTEFMRQKDDLAFAHALDDLGNYGLMGLSDEQVQMFDSRIKKDRVKGRPYGIDDMVTNVRNDTVFLFYTNENVHELNQKRVDLMSEREPENKVLINTAEYEIVAENDDWYRNAEQWLQTNRLRSTNISEQLLETVILKVNLIYTIYRNMDINDGLVNGSSGKLKYYLLQKKDNESDKQYSNLAFIQFDDPRVGAAARKRFWDKFKDMRNVPPELVHVDKDWTPIYRCEQKLTSKDHKGWKIFQRQFPFELSEGTSIHKSQGYTLPSVAFDLSQTGLSTAMIYVAWSRVRKLIDLYLFGKRSITEGKNYNTMSLKARREKSLKEQMARAENFHTELDGLRRHCQFRNIFSHIRLDEKQEKVHFNVMFYHTEHINTVLRFLDNDIGVQECDLFFLYGSSHTVLSQSRAKVKGFEIISFCTPRFINFIKPEFYIDPIVTNRWPETENILFSVMVKPEYRQQIYVLQHPRPPEKVETDSDVTICAYSININHLDNIFVLASAETGSIDEKDQVIINQNLVIKTHNMMKKRKYLYFITQVKSNKIYFIVFITQVCREIPEFKNKQTGVKWTHTPIRIFIVFRFSLVVQDNWAHEKIHTDFVKL